MIKNKFYRRSYLFLLLFILVYINGCFNFGSFCWSRNYAPTILDLHVFEGTTQLDDLNHSKIITFGEIYDDMSGITQRLQVEGRFSADDLALIVGNFESATVINYGSALKSGQDKIFFETSVFSHSQRMVDVFPSKNKYLIADSESGSLSNSFTGESYSDILLQSTIHVKEMGTDESLKEYIQETTFSDSISYTINEIFAPRFDLNGDVIFIGEESHFQIVGTGANAVHNMISQEYQLVKMSDNGILDTLFNLPSLLTESEISLDLRIGEHAVLIASSSELVLYRYNGEILYRTQNNGSYSLSNDGMSLSYDNGKMYYRVSDEKTIDLSLVNGRITHSQPYENYIISIDDFNRLSVIDTESESIAALISADDLPDLPEKTGKATIQKIYYPLMDSDGRVKVLLSDKYVIDDPDDPCDVSY